MPITVTPRPGLSALAWNLELDYHHIGNTQSQLRQDRTKVYVCASGARGWIEFFPRADRMAGHKAVLAGLSADLAKTLPVDPLSTAVTQLSARLPRSADGVSVAAFVRMLVGVDTIRIARGQNADLGIDKCLCLAALAQAEVASNPPTTKEGAYVAKLLLQARVQGVVQALAEQPQLDVETVWRSWATPSGGVVRVRPTTTIAARVHPATPQRPNPASTRTACSSGSQSPSFGEPPSVDRKAVVMWHESPNRLNRR